jgi:hypothetical protein
MLFEYIIIIPFHEPKIVIFMKNTHIIIYFPYKSDLDAYSIDNEKA